MLRKRHERGEGQFGCLVGIVVLLIAALIAYKMIPVKVKAADLRETVADEAKSAGQQNDAKILKNIMAKANELKLPVKEDDVRINRSSGTINIDVKYTVPVVFPGYTYQWNFHHHSENPIF